MVGRIESGLGPGQARPRVKMEIWMSLVNHTMRLKVLMADEKKSSGGVAAHRLLRSFRWGT